MELNLGDLERKRGAPEAARTAWLAAADAAVDSDTRARAFGRLAALRREAGDLRDAGEYLKEALAAARDPDVLAELLLHQARGLELAGDADGAYRARKSAIETAQEPALKAAALRALAVQEETRRTPASARRYYEEADRYARLALEQALEPETRAIALRAAADLLRAEERGPEALAAYRKALEITFDPAARPELEKMIKALEISEDAPSREEVGGH